MRQVNHAKVVANSANRPTERHTNRYNFLVARRRYRWTCAPSRTADTIADENLAIAGDWGYQRLILRATMPGGYPGTT